VDGVLNADPKRVKETELLKKISYQDAAEMTYYGASVIHPKTIKPLANQGIPLFVRSFLNAKAEGTEIADFPEITPQPSIIFKSNQSVLRFEARDLSNINQRALAKIIETLSDLSIRINLMMNTAVSFSICANTQQEKFEKVTSLLESEFEISVRDNLELVTLKNYSKETIADFYQPEKALIELKTPTNFQFVNEG
jgi:aspartate kinase